MQKNPAATVERRILRIDLPSSDAPTWKRAANDGPATHQLQFAYVPVIPVKPSARATAELLLRWMQNRSTSMTPARPVPGFRDAAGVLSKADRFFLGHAASALKNLQSMGIAGRAVIHLSTFCLTDPLLPVYVVSLLQRRGVSLVGVNVTLGTGRKCCLAGNRTLHDAAPQSPTRVRHHTDEPPIRQPSWVNALPGRLAIP